MAAQILQLDASGQPVDWITWQDAAIYYAKGQVVWELGSTASTIHGGENRITGKQSKIMAASIIAVKGDTKGRLWKPKATLTNKDLFRRDQNLCAYCGNVFGDSKLTRDHILPKSRGGLDTWTNLVTCCTSCNQYKDDRTPEEAHMPLLYVPYKPSRAEHLILENRNVLFDQMQFLLNFIPEDSPIRKKIAAGEIKAAGGVTLQ